jgi:lactate dehydrogenase-like 2-hydroxyacid dehydrogenase
MMRDDLIAIGRYDDWDVAAMAERWVLHRVAGPGALAGLPAALRARVRLVAYRGHARFDAAAMDQLPALGMIANYGVGFDAIDVAGASARGIRVSNTPGVLTADVADLTVGMMIAFSRNLVPAARWLAEGRWPVAGDPPLARSFSGGRVGILGLGRIGRAIADRLAAFGMTIAYSSRNPRPVPPGWTFHADPRDLAADCDWLVVSVVGGEATRGLVSAALIDAMGPDSVLVNIARGSVVDEPALLAALGAGRIRGAVLDVFWNEPTIDPAFQRLPNVLALPHQGSATVETRRAMGALQRANLAAFAAGAPLPTPVN